MGSQPPAPAMACQAVTSNGNGTKSASTVTKRKKRRPGRSVRKSRMANTVPTGSARATVPSINPNVLPASPSRRFNSRQACQPSGWRSKSTNGMPAGTPIPILAGTRVSGQVARYDVGVLAMKTEQSGATPSIAFNASNAGFTARWAC